MVGVSCLLNMRAKRVTSVPTSRAMFSSRLRGEGVQVFRNIAHTSKGAINCTPSAHTVHVM